MSDFEKKFNRNEENNPSIKIIRLENEIYELSVSSFLLGQEYDDALEVYEERKRLGQYTESEEEKEDLLLSGIKGKLDAKNEKIRLMREEVKELTERIGKNN